MIFLNDLEDLKNKYFYDWSEPGFSRYASYYLLKGTNESNEDYLNNLKEFDFFDLLNRKSSYGLPMVVAYNCISYKITNIKNHIYGKFSK